MSAVQDSLVEISRDLWQILADRFKNSFPRGFTGYQALRTQIINKDNDLNVPANVYSPFGNPDDGVVIIFNMVECNTEILILSLQNDLTKLTQAVFQTNKINWNQRILFGMVVKNVAAAFAEVLEKNNKIFSLTDTYISTMSREEIMNFDSDMPSDVTLGELDEKHAAEVDENYPHQYVGSKNYFEYMLRNKLAIGIFGKEKKELRAWILTSLNGSMHALQVKDEFKRRGYGSILLKQMSKRVISQDRPAFGCIVTRNVPSVNLFTSLGFKFLPEPVTWIEVYPDSYPEKI